MDRNTKTGRELLDITPTGLATVIDYDTDVYEFFGDQAMIERLMSRLQERFPDVPILHNDKENGHDKQ